MDDETANKIGELITTLLAIATDKEVHKLPGAFEPGDFNRLDVIKDRELIRSKMQRNIDDAISHCKKDNHPMDDVCMVWPKKFHEIAESLPVHFAPEHQVPAIGGVEAECWRILVAQ